MVTLLTRDLWCSEPQQEILLFHSQHYLWMFALSVSRTYAHVRPHDLMLDSQTAWVLKAWVMINNLTHWCFDSFCVCFTPMAVTFLLSRQSVLGSFKYFCGWLCHKSPPLIEPLVSISFLRGKNGTLDFISSRSHVMP